MAQSNITEKFLVNQWTTEQGLPGNKINAICQQDYLWIGTNAGLVRFDGLKFKVFTKINTPELHSDEITALYTVDKKLWIGTNGSGLCCYQNGQWTNYTTEDGLSNNHIKCITGDWEGNLWIGTEYGLNRLSDGVFEYFTTDDGLAGNIITALEFDNWGNLWIGSLQRGVTRFLDGGFVIFDNGVGLNNLFVNEIITDKKGNLFVGTIDGIFCKNFNQDYFTKIITTDYMPVTDLLENRDEIWFGTMNEGLKYLKHGRLKHYTDFPEKYITCLFKDTDDNIWIGTETEGITQISPRKIDNISIENDVNGKSITALLKDSDHNFGFGVRNFGLCQYKNNLLINSWDNTTKLGDAQIISLCMDYEGVLWIGTEASGIFLLKEDEITLFNELTSGKFQSIYQEESGNIWIGSDHGLSCYRGQFLDFSDAHELKSQNIVNISEKNGNLYIATKNNIYIRSNREFSPLLQEEFKREINSFFIHENSILIGTNGNGLHVFQERKHSIITTESGLPDNYIFSISSDRYNNFWLSTNTGVIKISEQEIFDFVDGKMPMVFPTKFDESDGMVSSQCIGSVQPAVWQDQLNMLYYPTSRGIVSFDPDRFRNEPKPKVIIDEISVNDKLMTMQSLAQFDKSIDQIQITFTSVNFQNTENQWIRYGLNDDEYRYISPSDDRSVNLSDLKAGQYTLHIQAKNNNSDWGVFNSDITFTIRSFYQKPAFYAILIGMIGIMVIIVLIRKRKPHQKNDKLEVNQEIISAVDPEIIAQLEKLMEKDKVYLDPDLTMKILAQKLHIHNNNLSKIINEHFQINFNDYINQYRIIEAKIMLAKTRKKTVSEIMYSCGFYSKSTFNTAFKKFTDLTPSQYRKQVSSK